jgi:TolB-like protein/Tfp pilus assembly protein PilF
MSLYSELKRRNVFRVAIAYAVAAWLLIEVSATTFPLLNLPDWTATFITVLLIIGFPVALIFAWAFELTPEGLKKEKQVDRSHSITHLTGRKLDYIIIGVLTVAVAYFLLDKFVWLGEEPPTDAAVTAQRKSIAVLPFANRSDNPEDVFFVDGFHDDVLTQISKISALTVISRTSVMEYRDTTKNLKTIGDELGAATILEGGVQRAGDQIRINVQLIDTGTDEHLWADTYDRALTAGNIFAIQSEIATAIAGELRAILSPEEQAQLAKVPTENLAALEAYFHGKQGVVKRTSGTLAEAVDHFQQAIELDPDFALAYVGLAHSYILQNTVSGLPRDEMLPRVEAAIDRALELDDQSGEVYAILGDFQRKKGDFVAAEMAFKRALELKPNYARAHLRYAIFLYWYSRPEEALTHFRRAQELDPLSAIINEYLGNVLRDLGRVDAAMAQYQKAIKLDPAFPGAYRNIGRIYSRVSGQLDEAVVWYRKAIAFDPGNPAILTELGWICLELGDEHRAANWINRSLELAPESSWANTGMALLSWYRGQEAEALDYARKGWDWFYLAFLRDHDLQAGRYAEARARYERGYPALLNEDAPTIDQTNYGAAIDLAYVLPKTGEPERANMLLSRALTFIQSIPRLGLRGHLVADVRIYALQGQTPKALAALREAIDAGWRVWWWYFLEHDPLLDPIRDEPEFQAMVAEVRDDMAAQLARLREWEAKGELAPIPDSLK